MNPTTNEWIEWFINEYQVELCKLYYEPYNFKRTGCLGCPFNIKLQDTLDTLEKTLPLEKKKAEAIWKEVYGEKKLTWVIDKIIFEHSDNEEEKEYD